MASTYLGNTTTTDLTDKVDNYSVPTAQTEGATGAKETEYMNNQWPIQLGYYKKIPELQKAIQALAIWSVGKGFTTDTRTQAILDNITGWGEDTFESIMFNMLLVKKIGGDSFCEIMRNPDTGTIINIRPLDPGSIKTIVDEKGIIIRYEQVNKINKKEKKTFQPKDILHFSNDRIADEIHGTSVIDACEWTILARNEAMADKKRIHHRSTIRIIEVDEDNETELAKLTKQYEIAIDRGEALIVPKGNVGFPEATLSYLDTQNWIQYLENFFYQAVGVPRIIATPEGNTEAASKVGFLTFEPVYTHEQFSIEGDLWQQLAIKVKFSRPPSIGGDLQRDEAKDAEQTTSIQPNETGVTNA